MVYIADRISLDPDLCNGKPTIRGMRIAVQTILEFLYAGDKKEDILAQYPALEPEDIDACMKFAIELMNQQFTFKSIKRQAA